MHLISKPVANETESPNAFLCQHSGGILGLSHPLVSAADSIKWTSSLWEDRRPYEVRPPPTRELLAIFSSGPPLQLNRLKCGKETAHARLLALLQPESPTSPCLAAEPISTPRPSGDVTLDSIKKTNGARSTVSPIPNCPPPPFSGPGSVVDAASSRDVSMDTSSILSKPRVGSSLTDGATSMSEKTQDGSATQGPINIGKPMVSRNDPENHIIPGQVSGRRPKNSQSDGINITSARKKTQKRKTISYPLPVEYDRNPLPTQHIYSLLLKKSFDKFRNKVESNAFGAPRQAVKHRFSDLPYAMTKRSKPLSGVVMRPLRRHSHNSLQTPAAMTMFYRYLLESIYKLHQDQLNDLDVPLWIHRVQHQKLVDWLDVQFFTPADSLPLMGFREIVEVKRRSDEIGHAAHWRPDDKFGTIQLKLLDLFSQDRSFNHLGPVIIPELLDAFKTQHEAPRRASEVPMSLDFQQKNKFLLDLAKKSEDFGQLLTKQRKHVNSDPVLSPSCVYFTSKCDKTPLSNDYLEFHPRLPLAIYFPDHTLGSDQKPLYGILRVIKQQGDKTMIPSYRLDPKFKRLIAAVDCLHLEVLELSEMDEAERDKRRESISRWLARNVVDEYSVLPIIGKIALNDGLAPWEDPSYAGAGELYTPIQSRLIKHLSGMEEFANLQETSAFILNTWYQDHHSTWFDSLAGIKSIKTDQANQQ
ncbi:hypothetical protein MJO28_011759 [Puccinia striiformis f. sp. tritici]|uniref:Uncharacterized protein n=1 Tax=Puccinia striiformis f. sp. tritici TaxID=168172 RepID=A0ACC0E3L0_9BASI|nr:hypothetical protein MJO28_011759 [Puccinia striiformis f. sp. tritici]